MAANPKAFVESLTAEEAIDFAEAIIARERIDAFRSVASTFPTSDDWPPDYAAITAWRSALSIRLSRDYDLAEGARAFYRENIAAFIDHWCVTYDPRNASREQAAKMPFVLFQRQRELVDFLLACINSEESGLVEKSRDMGATWVCCAVSVGLWLFWPGAAIGWGSRKEQLVDKLGDPDSIFEKMRMLVRALPPVLLPRGFSDPDDMSYMKFINPETGATITGEAGDNIGRGGRKLAFFKDESSHYERPEKIEAALADNTNVQIDISSVNGLGNVFHRRREAGKDWIPGEPLEPGRTAVFVMDWRDHPAKDEAWYQRRRQKAEDDGLLYVFRQEVDRDYSAALEGTIIPAEWIRAAIDAHIKLGFDDDGLWVGGLDVADGMEGGSGDVNALALRKGVVLRSTDSWGARDTGETARKAVTACEGKGFMDLQYDCIGVGAGVKAETNRLEAEGLLPPGLHLVPWHAGTGPLNPDDPVIPDDRDSPINKDFFKNLKAQAWWAIRGRFERTFKAVAQGVEYDPSELISLDSTLPQLRQIEKELAQPTATRSGADMKLLVNKAPEGTRSPNLGDAIVMAYHPVTGLRHVYATAADQIETPPIKIPAHWKRGYAMRVEPTRVSVLWVAFDDLSDILYAISEHSRSHAEPSAHAAAIRARGAWMPGFLETDGAADETRQTIDVYRSLGLKVDISEKSLEAGIADMGQRIATARFKIFPTCTEFLKEYRSYRRAEDGSVIGSGLIDCGRILCRPSTLQRLAVKPAERLVTGPAARPRLGNY